MEKKVGQQPEILENIKKEIAAAENTRRDLRFTYNLNDFLRGNIQVLKNDEFIAGLDARLAQDLLPKGEENVLLLERLGEGALVEESPVRERSLVLLSSVAKIALERKEQTVLEMLCQVLSKWLEFETELIAGFAVINKTLENLLHWFVKNGYWSESEEIIVLLHRIQSGSLRKSKAIQSLTGATLKNLERKAIVELLTDEYLLANERQQLFRNMLHSIGNKAAVYLLNRIIHSQSRPERLALLELLPTFGNVAIPALAECINSNPPWAVVRNVICIIAAIGNDDHFSMVKQYFSHPDGRVQQEMVNCVRRLGGPMMKTRLVEGLSTVHDRLKVFIIRLLVELPDSDQKVVTAILELARNSNTFSSQSEQEMLLALIAALKTFPCKKSIEQLQKIRAEQAKEKNGEQLLLHIDEALRVIEPKVRHQAQNAGSFMDIVSFDNDPVQQQLVREKVRETEEEIQSLVRSNDIQHAGKLLYDQAITAAKTKNFPVAELLRERLLEINPMALAEVIQLGEFIEEQKNTSITSHHLEIWNELYEEMTTEEFNDLYYSMRQENYHKGDIIVRSGETDTNLYFLNSGYISLSCMVAGKEVFLKRMQPSNVLGGDQFFSPSVWTVTLKALSEIQLHVLERAAMEKICPNYPGIEDKLRKYCLKHAQIPELLKMSGDDRREYPRFQVSVNARNVLLDTFGNKAKRSFNSELFDLSEKGLAFIIRITNVENARLLLGRHIVTTIIGGEEELPRQYGVIVGVRLHEPVMQDYSVHVKLAKKIDVATFKKILTLSNPTC